LRYVSTRGSAPTLDFDDALLAGLARDGGLYVPESWPGLSAADLQGLAGRPYAEAAASVMRPFVAGDGSEPGGGSRTIAPAELAGLVADAYATFAHHAVVPLREIGQGLWLMEQFHGPTLAFKDVAMQLLGRLFDHVLRKRGERVTIVGATSGDTGSAAIEACRDRQAIDIFILFPQGRVSEVQRRQMTTVDAPNVHCLAIDGTFDDCQDMVKAMFNDAGFRDEMRLSAVNSINWARVLAQMVYYVTAAVALGAPARPVRFAVPTGNFGNVYAGYGARAMGVPIERLIVGSNRNDILARFFTANDMSLAPVVPTSSPSMDIQVSSNFERLLFDLCDRDGAEVTRLMTDFRANGRLAIDDARWHAARAGFSGVRLDDTEVAATIRAIHAETGMLIDPHTAVGVEAARRTPGDPAIPTIALSTAHPAKFPDAVEAACGIRPALPDRLADLYDRPERQTPLPNDLAVVQKHVRGTLGMSGAA